MGWEKNVILVFGVIVEKMGIWNYVNVWWYKFIESGVLLVREVWVVGS